MILKCILLWNVLNCLKWANIGIWYFQHFQISLQHIIVFRKTGNRPWEIPDDDVFDTRADYAIKTASDGKRRFAFGWIASKYGNTDFGPWEWAEQ